MEDIKIIELFFNRDETAIQELSNKYSGYCYKIVWNLLNNHEDVEECLNDTWLAAWEYIPPRRPSVLSAYVGKIARGFAIDCFRKKQAAKRMDGHVADVCGEMDELSFSYVVDEKIAEKELIKIIEFSEKTVRFRQGYFYQALLVSGFHKRYCEKTWRIPRMYQNKFMP